MSRSDAIEGVTLDQYVAVTVAALRTGVTGTDALEALALRHGVPAGRWAGAQRAWLERMRDDPELRARYRRRLEQA